LPKTSGTTPRTVKAQGDEVSFYLPLTTTPCIEKIGAMQPEVISLFDSSDDEAPTAVKFQNQNKNQNKKSKQTTPSTVTSGNGGGGGCVIDLLDDDSDEDEASSEFCSGGRSSSVSARAVGTQDEESPISNLLTRPRLPLAQQCHAAATTGHSLPSRQASSFKSTSQSTFGVAPPRLASTSRSSEQQFARTDFPTDAYSDDSDNDSVLQYDSGLLRKKSNVQTAVAPTSSQPNGAQDHHFNNLSSSTTMTEEVLCPSTSSLGTLVTPRNNSRVNTTMGTGAKANQTPTVPIIANPYAQKNAGKPSLAVTISNPYAETISSTAEKPSGTGAGDGSVPTRHGATTVTLKTHATTKSTMMRTASLPSANDCVDSSNVVYPNLLSTTKPHADIRPKFLLAYWKYSRTLTHKSFDRPKLDQTAKKILALALSEYPMRSLEEYCARTYKVGGSGTFAGRNKKDDVKYELDKGGLAGFIANISTPVDACRNGRYYSIVEACLVSVLVFVEVKLRAKNVTLKSVMDDDSRVSTLLSDKATWMALQDLIPEVDKRLQDCCPGRLGRPNDPDWGAIYLTDKSTRSAEYKQLEKLCVGETPYLKEHKKRGEVCFEMTPLGCHTAQRIRTRMFPAPPGHYRCSNLNTVDPRYQDICLGVDMREGGGSGNVLHIMYVRSPNQKRKVL
jgi:hypothetical protein